MSKSEVEKMADAGYKRASGDNPMVWVLPFGFCLHLFHRKPHNTTFLTRCADLNHFVGFSWSVGRFRLLVLRVNYLPHEDLLELVSALEADRDVPTPADDNTKEKG